MKEWYVLTYKYGQVKRVQVGLERIGVNSFNPTIQVQKPRMDSGTLRSVYESMFPTYLFVEFDVVDVHTTTVTSVPGVNYFIKFGAAPRPIPYSIISSLINRMESDQDIAIKLKEISLHSDKLTRGALLISLIEKTPIEQGCSKFAFNITP
ncbi:TPA: transcription termination/antitermination NusG family protein [Yersinia enterocolitica]